MLLWIQITTKKVLQILLQLQNTSAQKLVWDYGSSKSSAPEGPHFLYLPWIQWHLAPNSCYSPSHPIVSYGGQFTWSFSVTSLSNVMKKLMCEVTSSSLLFCIMDPRWHALIFNSNPWVLSESPLIRYNSSAGTRHTSVCARVDENLDENMTFFIMFTYLSSKMFWVSVSVNSGWNPVVT